MALAPDKTSTGTAATTLAGWAVLLGYLGGLYFLYQEKKSRFVQFYALQSIRITLLLLISAVCNMTHLALGFLSGDSALNLVMQAGFGVFFFLWLAAYAALAANAFRGKVLVLPLFGAGLRNRLDLD